MGFCGFYGFENESLIKKMSNSLPGGAKELFLDSQINIASNNFSDESFFESDSQNICVAYEGEIYYDESLFDLLKQNGFNFQMYSDVELIFQLYILFGINFTDHLQGNFSCVIWDGEKDELYIIREDAHNPIYYTIFENNLVFSSSIKSFFHHEMINKELNVDCLDSLFALGYVPGENTLFKNIKEIKPYNILFFKKGSLGIKQYWKTNILQSKSLTEKEWVEKIHSMLTESVDLRMNKSDGTKGILLSGGLDSCTVASLMNKFDENTKAITVQYEEGNSSEPEALQIAKWLGIPTHQKILTSEDMIGILPNLACLFDNLILDYIHVLIPSYAGIEHSHQNKINTLFTGDGGDSVFWGFPVFYDWENLLSKCSKVPLFLRKNILCPSLNLIPENIENDTISLAKLVFNVSTKSTEDQLLYSGRLFDENETEQIFSDDLNESISLKETKVNDYLHSHTNCISSSDNISKRYYIYQMTSATYGTPSEIRYYPICQKFPTRISTPFCDKNIKAAAATMPIDLKHPSRNKSKYVLRKIGLEYDLLPKWFLKGYKKRGFSSPVATWLQGDVKDFITENVEDNLQMLEGILDKDYTIKILNSNRSRQILALYLFSEWYKYNFKKI